jgi:uncharacterized protein YdhG (YjbR/CyaY superfamily)
MMKSYENVDEYIQDYPQNVQAILKKVRQTIKAAAPKAKETISYKIPVYDVNGKHVVFFAGWKNHLSLYPAPVVAFKKELAEYETAKGTVKFPLDKPVPYELIKKMVTYLIKQNLAQTKRNNRLR